MICARNKDQQSRSATPCCPRPSVAPGGVCPGGTPPGTRRGAGVNPAKGEGQDHRATLLAVGPVAGSSGSRRWARWPSRTDRPAAGPPLAGADRRVAHGSSSRLACAVQQGRSRLPGRACPRWAALGQLGWQSGHDHRGLAHPGHAPAHHDRVGPGRPTRPIRSWSPAYADHGHSPTYARVRSQARNRRHARAQNRDHHGPVMRRGRRWPCADGRAARAALARGIGPASSATVPRRCPRAGQGAGVDSPVSRQGGSALMAMGYPRIWPWVSVLIAMGVSVRIAMGGAW